MSARGKDAGDLSMALGASLVADEGRAGDLGRSFDSARDGGTGVQDEGSGGEDTEGEEGEGWVAGGQGEVFSIQCSVFRGLGVAAFWISSAMESERSPPIGKI